MRHLQNKLTSFSNVVFINNDNGFVKVLWIKYKHFKRTCSLKEKYAWGNQVSYLTKKLSNEIITRSRLCNSNLKNRNEENRAFKEKLRNYSIFLLRKSKTRYYKN